ncbi:hypothetical protein [Indioceanicola profundi]|uniref:hypothetical protein n=1 Tax=Indioceanicola profundi TaxID=2220096 RepID=UPI000E6AD3C3|nr:hypothetical protein [Indioceanicola profundi]
MTLSRFCRVAGTAALFSLATFPAFAFGPERFQADSIEVENLLGTLDIRVDANAKDITVSADGKNRELLDRLNIRQRGRAVVIDMDMPRDHNRNINVEDDAPEVVVTVPAGTGLEVEDMIGELKAQSGLADVRVSLRSAATMEFGQVRSMNVNAQGALNLEVDEVQNGMNLALHGAGNIEVGRVTGPADMAVKGVGNIEVDRVDGPVSISLNGMGHIAVEGGRADTLEIEVAGMGAVSFDGEAGTKRINKSGFASVSYQGKSM